MSTDCCGECDDLGVAQGPKGNDGSMIGAVARIVVPTASILAGNATPVTLLAAPGDGLAIKLIEFSTSITYNSAAYATNTTFQIYTDTATVVQGNDTVLLTSTANRHLTGNLIKATGATSTQLIANKALLFNVLTGNPTAGNSDIVLYIGYVIVTL